MDPIILRAFPPLMGADQKGITIWGDHQRECFLSLNCKSYPGHFGLINPHMFLGHGKTLRGRTRQLALLDILLGGRHRAHTHKPVSAGGAIAVAKSTGRAAFPRNVSCQYLFALRHGLNRPASGGAVSAHTSLTSQTVGLRGALGLFLFPSIVGLGPWTAPHPVPSNTKPAGPIRPTRSRRSRRSGRSFGLPPAASCMTWRFSSWLASDLRVAGGALAPRASR